MTEEEKILISAFFDNELEEAEKKAAENLIANNSKAYEYFQSLKVIENELNSFTEDSLLSNQAQKAFQSIESLRNSRKKNLRGYLDNFFNINNLGSGATLSRNRLGLAFSFAFVFSFGFLSNQFIIESPSGTSYSLEQFTNSKILTETIIKTRSGSDEDDFDESLQLLLEKMVSEKIITGRLNYGSESFVIFLESKFKDSSTEDFFCYRGYIKNNEKNFIYCKGLQENSFFYIN